MGPEVISIQSGRGLYGAEVMSTSWADIMITLLRNGTVRDDRDTNTEYIFLNVYYKNFYSK